jgi:hypothetical protein
MLFANMKLNGWRAAPWVQSILLGRHSGCMFQPNLDYACYMPFRVTWWHGGHGLPNQSCREQNFGAGRRNKPSQTKHDIDLGE